MMEEDQLDGRKESTAELVQLSVKKQTKKEASLRMRTYIEEHYEPLAIPRTNEESSVKGFAFCEKLSKCVSKCVSC